MNSDKFGIKFCFAYAKTDTDQLRSNRAADQRICFRYIDSTNSAPLKTEISSISPSSMAVQSGLGRTLSETPQTGQFLASRLILCRYLLESTRSTRFGNFSIYMYQQCNFVLMGR